MMTPNTIFLESGYVTEIDFPKYIDFVKDSFGYEPTVCEKVEKEVREMLLAAALNVDRITKPWQTLESGNIASDLELFTFYYTYIELNNTSTVDQVRQPIGQQAVFVLMKNKGYN